MRRSTPTARHRRATRPRRESRARRTTPAGSLPSALCDLCILLVLGLLAFGPLRRGGL